ncbi:hypothetical protein AALO_G00174210 [Alosa alosa]|uniref:Ig-like domain-containing protein n=1 Tax=Alosa alosa TaxID=278164 RepID=A0AAV6G8N4_9TELE|nr:B-cell antigen receptor complex-associated protein alpha chain isoform X1 [Alosa alosa]KAG5270954.1 hypothetical protein AALO_G00174210 [Alosa alosa]
MWRPNSRLESSSIGRKMDITVVFLFCVGTVGHFVFPPVFACVKKNLNLKLLADLPSLRVQVNGAADLKCCYVNSTTVNHTWVIRYQRDIPNNITTPKPVTLGPRVTMEKSQESGCQSLSLKDVQLNDTGFYQCIFSRGEQCIYSHGTYLQVFTPMARTLDISESWKNSIITIEGVLLLFSVLIPGICQLGKTKRLTQLKRKKQREEENIYEGLNLDGCDSTYHQIQRSNRHGPYQDVANVAEDDTQFEKP